LHERPVPIPVERPGMALVEADDPIPGVRRAPGHRRLTRSALAAGGRPDRMRWATRVAARRRLEPCPGTCAPPRRHGSAIPRPHMAEKSRGIRSCARAREREMEG